MAQSARQMGYMRQELLDHGCELSVGMAESNDGEDIPDLVNQAENEMRKDKKRYYASGSGKRQLRTLNKQLEDILVRNKDMESLLHTVFDRLCGQSACRYATAGRGSRLCAKNA